ncbi:MAG: hypothetical protein R2747_21045 [Pyrinomonadaceae bacterium]
MSEQKNGFVANQLKKDKIYIAWTDTLVSVKFKLRNIMTDGWIEVEELESKTNPKFLNSNLFFQFIEMK